MKTFFIIVVALIFFEIQSASARNISGFALPDSLAEFTLRYRSVDNLIILPVRINGDLTVNLILDTGCRNVVLFGKRFQNKLITVPNKNIEFSGMGAGKGVSGRLSLNNTVTIEAIHGQAMPIIIVPSDRIFQNYENIDGLIGYDIFTRFEVEIHPQSNKITFRSFLTGYVPTGYTRIDFDMDDSKPVINSSIQLKGQNHFSKLIIDTGSTLGLLIKSTDKNRYNSKASHTLGQGVNGLVKGLLTNSETVGLTSYTLNNIPTGIIYSPWHNYASLGMAVLKDYHIILNYAQSYMCLKKVV